MHASVQDWYLACPSLAAANCRLLAEVAKVKRAGQPILGMRMCQRPGNGGDGLRCRQQNLPSTGHRDGLQLLRAHHRAKTCLAAGGRAGRMDRGDAAQPFAGRPDDQRAHSLAFDGRDRFERIDSILTPQGLGRGEW